MQNTKLNEHRRIKSQIINLSSILVTNYNFEHEHFENIFDSVADALYYSDTYFRPKEQDLAYDEKTLLKEYYSILNKINQEIITSLNPKNELNKSSLESEKNLVDRIINETCEAYIKIVTSESEKYS
ncbi:MAG: hypothetical protein ACP5N2_06840 [Candidatus Nanoarchaeia archaeon]